MVEKRALFTCTQGQAIQYMSVHVRMYVHMYVHVPYSLDQMLLSISHRSRIVAALPDELNEIDATLEY